MQNAQLIIAILTALTPTVTVLIALLVQRQDTRDLRSDLQTQMKDLREDLQTQMKDLRQEMIHFRDQVHSDLLMIHERVAKVEAKQS